MELNKTNQRILKQWYQGKSLSRIARLIGRPKDIGRILNTLKRAEIPETRWYENEN